MFLYNKQPVTYPSFDVKKVLQFKFPLKICTFFKGIREWKIHFLAFVHFNLKKLKGFLNITDYKIFLIESFLITY